MGGEIVVELNVPSALQAIPSFSRRHPAQMLMRTHMVVKETKLNQRLRQAVASGASSTPDSSARCTASLNVPKNRGRTFIRHLAQRHHRPRTMIEHTEHQRFQPFTYPQSASRAILRGVAWLNFRRSDQTVEPTSIANFSHATPGFFSTTMRRPSE